MPCFKGLAVSIHTPEGPLSEYAIQKQSRQSRISSYIPVPAPKFTPGSPKPEPSSFAISITLLTPGSGVPYSRPAPTPDDPFPSQKIVGGLPGYLSERGKYGSVVGPYIPLTSSPNETVAAYIHFDGRAKEEVATLLRKGVETWVNSRWVSVPESEGGGLAEREFLFREVGLERWLNGLDLKGESKDVAARLERRKQRLEKKRRSRLLAKDSDDEDDEGGPTTFSRPVEKNGILRYGDDKASPVEDVSDEGNMLSTSGDDSDDEIPEPEAAGQIRVSLFRVMASGEIKKGEYSPSFDAHDDSDEGMQEHNGDDAGIDHTTTFAKPKALDPKTISTQTVTGIDDPSKPYATFTFFYRGERQLQKMGILPTPETDEKKTPTSTKRRSRQLDFSNLGPLKSEGTVGFAGYRDPTSTRKASLGTLGKKEDMDSDPEDETEGSGKRNGTENDDAVDQAEEDDKAALAPDEVARRGELAEGVKKMQLKRQHSFDPPVAASPPQLNPETSIESTSTTPHLPNTPNPTTTPALSAATSRLSETEPSDVIGSPFKKQRASVTTGEGLKLFVNEGSLSSAVGAGGGSESPQSSQIPDIKVEAEESPTKSAPSSATAEVKRDPSAPARIDEEL